jgi:hypothetical protein
VKNADIKKNKKKKKKTTNVRLSAFTYQMRDTGYQPTTRARVTRSDRSTCRMQPQQSRVFWSFTLSVYIVYFDNSDPHLSVGSYLQKQSGRKILELYFPYMFIHLDRKRKGTGSVKFSRGQKRQGAWRTFDKL